MRALLPVMVTMMCLAALVWAAFPAHYHWTTKGRWARTGHGRNVMALAVTLAAMIVATLASALLPPLAAVVVAVVLWAAVTYVGIRRHWLLWHDQHPRG